MKAKTRWGMAVGGLAGVVLAMGLLGRAQYGQTGGLQNQTGSRQQGRLEEGPETDSVFAERRLRALNADRHKSMVSDADKLLKLARQLDAEIASSPGDELTPEEMRKVAEIEKLARNVKTKMAQSFSGGPQFRTPAMPMGGPGED
jgi:hypothetical protein